MLKENRGKGKPFYQEIILDLIEFHPDQPRKLFEEKALAELSTSLKERVLQPIIVRPYGDKYQLIIGARRTKAAALAGLSKIPAYVIDEIEDAKILEIALTENIQREDLTPFEEALVILKLIKDYGYSIRDVYEKIGKSEDFVRLRLKLIALPEAVQKHIASGRLSLGHGTLLVKIDSPERQKELAQEMMTQSLSYEQAKERILEAVDEVKEKKKVLSADKKVYLLVKKLERLLGQLDYPKMPFEELENIKSALLGLKNQIEGVIQEIEFLA